MTIPTTIRHDGEDLTVTDLYDPLTLPKAIVVKAFPEGTTVAYKRGQYGKHEVGVLTSHTPHYADRIGGFSEPSRNIVRPARTSGPRRYYEKAETWANRSVGFLVTAADGEQVVTKHILGLPATVERIQRKAARAATESRKRERLNALAKSVRKGAAEYVLKDLTDEEARGWRDVVEEGRYGDLSVPLAVVEALLAKHMPGDLDHARALILDAIEAGTLPEVEA